jgi:MoaA/NifB/PqqE/SkfB family radical SAM enzyme
MLVQFEITTRCNFDCFYCAGRAMRQGDMSYEVFIDLLARHVERNGTPDTVSLQGEGEPTLHHDFFKMAAHVTSLGSRPYTITNGTYKHPERFAEHFSEVGVSIDTLEESAAERIGRYNLPRVLSFIAALAPSVHIVVHSVAHREHTPKIAAWCRQKKYRHIVQSLQTKPDYTFRYAKHLQPINPVGGFSCDYVASSRMRYYSLDGVEMPCCFIKDTSAYEGMEAMRAHQRDRTWPKVCAGCRYAKSLA